MLKTILLILYIAICAAMSICVLAQEGKGGLGVIDGTDATGTFWEKAKGRSKEGRVKKMTWILAGVFIVMSLVLSMV